MNPTFVFLGVCWNLDDRSSKVQNDRVNSIVQHRVPRSIPELAFRLATLQYYQHLLHPIDEEIGHPIILSHKKWCFTWEKIHSEAYGNLLYLMGLQVQNQVL